MKGIAQRDDPPGLQPGDDGGEPGQRRAGVVGRQEDPACRVGRALLQVQVGDDEQPLLRAEQRAGMVGDEGAAGEPQHLLPTLDASDMRVHPPA